jgi:hypothetical protein
MRQANYNFLFGMQDARRLECLKESFRSICVVRHLIFDFLMLERATNENFATNTNQRVSKMPAKKILALIIRVT